MNFFRTADTTDATDTTIWKPGLMDTTIWKPGLMDRTDTTIWKPGFSLLHSRHSTLPRKDESSYL